MNFVAGIAVMNLVVNNHSRAVLHQLHSTTKLDRLVEFSLHDGPGIRIDERHDALGNRAFPTKFVLGLSKQFSPQLDAFPELLLELGGRRRRQLLKSMAASCQRVSGQLGYFLEHFFTLGFTLFGFGFGTLAPTGQGSLVSPHMADDLAAQRTGRAGKRLDRLMDDPDIVGICDVGFQVVESIQIRRGLIERVLTSDLMSWRLSSPIRSSPNRWLSLINVVASGTVSIRDRWQKYRHGSLSLTLVSTSS